MAERVSQTVLQVVGIGTSKERVSQSVLQVAAVPTSKERVSQTVLQAIAIPSYQNSIVASSHNNSGVTASSITFPKPSGTTNKNLIIAVVSFSGDPGAVNITPPSGFNLAIYEPATTTPGSMGVYYKYAKGGEPSTYTFSWAGGNQIASGGMVTLTGPTLSNPIGSTASDVGVLNTNFPLTITLSPVSNYSTIIEILAWTGTQTFTGPTGPWSQQFVDTNAAGMSTALSVRNWDTGITTQQTAALSGNPSAYIATTIEVQGSVIPPPGKKKQPPLSGITRAIIGGKILPSGQVVFNYRTSNTLYKRMKRIGFPRKPIVLKTLAATPVVLHPNITVFKFRLMTLTASTINIAASLKKSIGKTLKAGLTLSSTLMKQPIKTLQSLISVSANLVKTRFINLTSSIVTLAAALNHGPSQLLIANVNVNASINLIKSILKNLIASSVTVTSSLLKTGTKSLSTAVTTAGTQIKHISKTLITNLVALVASLVHGPSILLSAVVNIDLGSSLIKTINPLLSASVTLTSTLSQFLSIALNSSVSVLSSINRDMTSTLVASVNTLASLFNSIGITLSSTAVSIAATLSKTGTAITVLLSTSVAVSTSLLKQMNQLLTSNLIVFINTLIHSTVIVLIADVVTTSTITKTIGKILKSLTRITAFLPGRQAPPSYALYMPLHSNSTVALNMPLLSTKLLYLSLNPAAKSDIIVNI